MPAKPRDAQPQDRRPLSDRLKSLHELGAAIRRQEAELKANIPPFRSLMSRLLYLRRLELQAWTMTPAERAEYAQLEREHQADHDDYERSGNASRDWTK